MKHGACSPDRPRVHGALRLCQLALSAALPLLSCATMPVRPDDMTDYVFPTPDAGAFRLSEVRDMESVWREVLAGKTAGAEKRLRKLRAAQPRAAAAETMLGYALLRAGKLDRAEAAFLAVVSRHPGYVPGLAGAGTVFRRRGDSETATELFRRATEAGGPGTPAIVRRRLGEAKLEVTEAKTSAARRAIEAGQEDRAIEEYTRLLHVVPELADVRLELAALLHKRGDQGSAIEVLSHDPGEDRQVLLRLAALYLGAGRPDDALRATQRLLARDPSDEDARRLGTRAESDIELMRMPEEYRRILVAPRITRADLAALLSVKVTRLASLPVGEPPVATDISGSWARQHILQVLGLGIMAVFPNHTFQPAGVVRRSDMALALSRTLDLVGVPSRPLPALADVSPASLYYDAAARAVAEGLMDVTPAGSFEPWRAVTGPEAAAVAAALDRLLRPTVDGQGRQR